MYCELKNDKWWVWSSRLASLDCMPQYKVIADSANNALLAVCAIKKAIAKKKAIVEQLERKRIAYRDKIDAQKELSIFSKTATAKIDNTLYKWAANLNNIR